MLGPIQLQPFQITVKIHWNWSMLWLFLSMISRNSHATSHFCSSEPLAGASGNHWKWTARLNETLFLPQILVNVKEIRQKCRADFFEQIFHKAQKPWNRWGIPPHLKLCWPHWTSITRHSYDLISGRYPPLPRSALGIHKGPQGHMILGATNCIRWDPLGCFGAWVRVFQKACLQSQTVFSLYRFGTWNLPLEWDIISISSYLSINIYTHVLSVYQSLCRLAPRWKIHPFSQTRLDFSHVPWYSFHIRQISDALWFRWMEPVRSPLDI